MFVCSITDRVKSKKFYLGLIDFNIGFEYLKLLVRSQAQSKDRLESLSYYHWLGGFSYGHSLRDCWLDPKLSLTKGLKCCCIITDFVVSLYSTRFESC